MMGMLRLVLFFICVSLIRGNLAGENPCSTVTCPKGEVCEKQDVLCKKPPCPPVGVCVPQSENKDPCSNVTCPDGEVCRVQVDLCEKEPCKPPKGVCVPEPKKPDPCNDKKCPDGTICKVHVIYCIKAPCPPPTAVCEPIEQDDCSKITCAPNEVCEVRQEQCPSKLCPRKAVCVPSKKLCKFGNPLTNATREVVICNDKDNQCPDSYKCQTSLSGGQKICCLKDNPCDKVKCDKGQTCELQEVVCVRAPCNPVPVCVDKRCKIGEPLKDDNEDKPIVCDKDKKKCPEPYECQSCHKDAEKVCCLKNDPCRNVTCVLGETCELRRECIKESCELKPVCVLHQCKYGDPLEDKNTRKPVICDARRNITCPGSYHCEASGNKRMCCPNNPCETTKCDKGQICELQEVQCIRAPCYPVPTCVDQQCKVGPPLQDNGGKPIICDKKNNCPEPYACQSNSNNNGNICCLKNDPCGNKTCKSGEICELQKDCNKEYCTSKAVCVQNQCKYGDPLLVEYTGKPVTCNKENNTCPKLYQCESSSSGSQGICCPSDPCQSVKCPEGEICEVRQVQCIRAPCPPRGVCVPTSCPYGQPLKYQYTKEPVNCCNNTENRCPGPYQCHLSQTDGRGICCPIKKFECPLLKCIKNCDNYKYNEKGCRTCECISPCPKKCKKGQTCKLLNTICDEEPCPPVPVCVDDEETSCQN